MKERVGCFIFFLFAVISAIHSHTPGLPLNIFYKSPGLFTDFSPTFDQLPDPFWKADSSHFYSILIQKFCINIYALKYEKWNDLNIKCLQFMLRNTPFLILLAIYGK